MDPKTPNPAQTPLPQPAAQKPPIPTVTEIKPAPLICKYCKHPVSEDSYFCLNCGKKIKDKPLSTSIGRQIYLYALSILMPPLGLWPGLKYLFAKDKKSQIIGMILIVLTIISTVVTIKITMDLLGGITNSISGGQNTEIEQFENSGY